MRSSRSVHEFGMFMFCFGVFFPQRARVRRVHGHRVEARRPPAQERGLPEGIVRSNRRVRRRPGGEQFLIQLFMSPPPNRGL